MTDEQLEKGKVIQQKLKDAKTMKDMLEPSEYAILIQVKNKKSQYVSAYFNQHPTTKQFYPDAVKHIRSYFLGIVDSEIKMLEEQLEAL